MTREPRPESIVLLITEQVGDHQLATGDVGDPAPQRHAALTQALREALGRSLTCRSWMPGAADASELRAAIAAAKGTLIIYAAGGIRRDERGHLVLRGTANLSRTAQTMSLSGLARAVANAPAHPKLQVLDLRAGPDDWNALAEHPTLPHLLSLDTAVLGHIRVTDRTWHSLSDSYTWTELLTCILRDGIGGIRTVMSLGEIAASFPHARSLSPDRSVFVLHEGDWPSFLNLSSTRSDGGTHAR